MYISERIRKEALIWKIPKSYSCIGTEQVLVRVVVDLSRRSGEKHPHDRVAQQQDPGIHNQIDGFCLDQTGLDARPDAIPFSGPEVLRHKVGDGCHHGIIDQNGDLISFGSGSVTGNRGTA